MKSLLFYIIVVAFAATSCSNYTCPTYAKKSPTKTDATVDRKI